jgi:hypothetical protein
MGEKKNACKILVGICEWIRSRRTRRCEWEDNIKMNIKEEFLRVLTVSYWLRIGSGSRLL